MARKVTAYACEWGCRRRVVTSKASAEEHEARCYQNPARQACATCEHDFIEYPMVKVPGELTAEEVRDRTIKACTQGHREEEARIVFDCPHWEPKRYEGHWDDEPEWEA